MTYPPGLVYRNADTTSTTPQPGDLQIDLSTYTLFIADATGTLIPVGTGGNGNYSNTNVQAFLNSGTFSSDFIPQDNAVHSLGSSTNQWKDLWLSGNTLYLSTIPLSVVGTQLTWNGNAIATLSPDGNIVGNLLGNVFGGTLSGDSVQAGTYLYGNGTPIPNLGYGNTEVAAYLPTNTANVQANNINTLGSISTAGDIFTQNITATGNANSAQVFATQVNTNIIQSTGANSGILISSSSGNVNFNGAYLNNINLPQASGDAVNKAYTDGLLQGLQVKQAVVLATANVLPDYVYDNGVSGVGATITGNTTGTLSIDSTSATDGIRVLVKNETGGNAPYNGIYVVSQAGNVTDPYILTRSTDADTPALIYRAYTFVTEGATNFGSGFVDLDQPVTIGVDPITWTQFSDASGYIPGNALSLTGSQFNVLVDNDTIGINGSNQLNVKPFANLQNPILNNATGTDISISGNLVANTLTANTNATVSGNLQVTNALATGNVLAQSFATTGPQGNISGVDYYLGNNAIITNNVTANRFIGNGSQLTGMYSNANVAAYLPTSPVIISINGNIANTNSNVANTNSNVANTNSNVANLTTALANTNSNVANISSNVSVLSNAITSTNANVAVLSNTLANTNSNVTVLQGNVVNLTSALSNTNSNVANIFANVTTLQGQVYANANAFAYLGSNSNVVIRTTGAIRSFANIQGSYILGNGAFLTGLPEQYANSNVFAYLGSNSNVVISTTGNIRTTANISGGNIGTNGNIVATGNITATANISGNYVLGNGAFLTGLPAGYANSNAFSYLGSNSNVVIVTTGNITTSGNVSGNFLLGKGDKIDLTNHDGGYVYINGEDRGLIIDSGNVDKRVGFFKYSGTEGAIVHNSFIPFRIGRVPQANIVQGNVGSFISEIYVSPTGLVGINTESVTAQLTVNGNVAGNFFIGNGSQLTGMYSNTNVFNYLGSNSNVVITTTNNITTTANITAGRFNTNVMSMYSNVVSSSTDITIDPRLGGNTVGTVFVLGNLQVSGNIIYVDATSVTTDSLQYVAANNAINAAAADTGGLIIGPSIAPYATWTYSNASNSWVSNINISTPGNVTANYLIGDGSQITGLPAAYANADVFNYLGSNSNVVILTTGSITTTASISGNYILGNGAFLTGLPEQYANSNVFSYLGSNSNVVITTTGNITTNANISGNYILGNGAFLTGLPAGYANSNAFSYLGSNSNVVITTTGNITTAGNVSANYLLGNGAFITDLYANANVFEYLGSNSNVVITTTGNITGNHIVAESGEIGDLLFNTTVISAPNTDEIVAEVKDTDSIVRASLTLDPSFGTVELAAVSGPSGANFTNTNWTSGEWVTGIGVNYINFVDSPDLVQFYNAINPSNLQYLKFSINTGSYLPFEGATVAGNNITFNTSTVPSPDPTVVNIIQFEQQFTSTIDIDYDTGNMNLNADQLNINIVGSSNVNVEGNAVQVVADSSLELVNNGQTWNFAANGILTAPGNIAANYFIGNGSQLTGLPVMYSNADVFTYLGSNSNVVITTTGNITSPTFKTSNLTISGNTIGSTVGDIIIDPKAGSGNDVGTLFVLGNLQVAGNIIYVDANTVVTDSLLYQAANNAINSAAANGAGIAVGPAGNSYARWTYNSVSNAWSTTNNVVVGGNVVASGNVSGNFILGNGGQLNLTNVSNSYVYLNRENSGIVVDSGGIDHRVGLMKYALIEGALVHNSSIPLRIGRVNQANILQANAAGFTSEIHILANGLVGINTTTPSSQLTVNGNVAGNFFIGNGSALTGMYSNTNVFSYLGSNSNVVITTTGSITTAGNISTSSSVNATGNITASGNITTTANISGNYILGNGAFLTGLYANSNVFSYLGSNSNVVVTTTGNITTTGNVAGNFFIGNGSLLTGMYSNTNAFDYLGSNSNVVITTTGNVTAGNVTAIDTISGNNLVATNNVNAVYINTANLTINSNTITSSTDITIDPRVGNSDIGNVYVLGNLQVTGNLTFVNANSVTTDSLQYVAANNAINAAAADTGGLLVGPSGNAYASWTYSNGSNSWVSNLNITTPGNVNANYFIGNGSQLTGLYANANVFSYLGSNSNVVITTTSNITTTGNVTATGNVSGNFILGNGGLLNLTNVTGDFVYLNRENSGIVVDVGNTDRRVGIMKYNGQEAVIAHGNTSPFRIGRVANANVLAGNAGTFTSEIYITSGGLVGINTQSPTSQLTVNGNIAGNFFIGNGSQLVGVTNITNGTSNVTIPSANSNVIINVAGNTVGRLTTTDQVSFGRNAGGSNQGANSIAIGRNAGSSSQGTFSVAIGFGAGNITQNAYSVSVGFQSGNNNQQLGAVAVGSSAGANTQGEHAVAIGDGAGSLVQGNQGVAIGWLAAGNTQGANSVAIGAFAGYPAQVANSIVLNASGANLSANTAGLYIDPVRNDSANITNAMFYNTATKEVTYGEIVTGSPLFTIINSNITAVMGTAYGVDTSSSAVTVTLPTTPDSGESVRFVDAGGAFATNNLTIDPNGQNINNVSGNMIVSTNGASFGLLWNGTTWRVFQ